VNDYSKKDLKHIDVENGLLLSRKAKENRILRRK
jgi:hypothetical protein